MSKRMRTIIGLCIVAIILVSTIIPNGAIIVERFYGDIDNDGYVTTEDARIALLVTAGIYEKTLRGMDFEAADVDFDGYVSTQDARIILQVAAGQLKKTSMEGFEFSEKPEDFADKINEYRFEKNHDAVKFHLSPELCTAARAAAEEFALNTNTAFTREDGTYFYKLLDEKGIEYTTVDKIVIQSSFSYEYAVEQILNDSQAEKSLISDNFSNIGVGAFSSDGRTFYWCIFLTK